MGEKILLIHKIGYKNRFSRRAHMWRGYLGMLKINQAIDVGQFVNTGLLHCWGISFPQHLEDPRPCFENRRRVNCLNLISSLFQSCIRIDAPSKVVLYVKGKERLPSYKPRETFHFSRITTATLPTYSKKAPYI